MFIGARVAYVLVGRARVGVVTKLEDDQAIVKLDNGQTIPANTDRLRLVNYWRDRVRDRDADEFRYYPNDTAAGEIFTNKRGATFGVAAMRAIWYWGNDVVFNRELHEPKLVFSQGQGKYGEYKIERGKMLGRIRASAANHNMYELASTMLHEMVHQYNFEIDRPAGRFDPKFEGSHGKIFMQWLPKIRERTSIVIGVKGKPIEDVTYFDSDTSDELITKPFIFAIIRFRKHWYGFTLGSEQDLIRMTGEIGSLLRRQSVEETDPQVYAGISTLNRVKNTFIKAGRGGAVNLRRLNQGQPPPIIKLAVRTARPIDGWNLPDVEQLD